MELKVDLLQTNYTHKDTRKNNVYIVAHSVHNVKIPMYTGQIRVVGVTRIIDKLSIAANYLSNDKRHN